MLLPVRLRCSMLRGVLFYKEEECYRGEACSAVCCFCCLSFVACAVVPCSTLFAPLSSADARSSLCGRGVVVRDFGAARAGTGESAISQCWCDYVVLRCICF